MANLTLYRHHLDSKNLKEELVVALNGEPLNSITLFEIPLRADTTNLLFDIIKTHPLKKVSLSSTRFNDNNVAPLLDYLGKINTLTTLELDNSFTMQNHLDELKTLLSEAKQLRILKLGNLRNKHINLMADVILRHPHLESVRLCGINVEDSTIELLQTINKKLEVNKHRNHLTDAVDALTPNSNVTRAELEILKRTFYHAVTAARTNLVPETQVIHALDQGNLHLAHLYLNLTPPDVNNATKYLEKIIQAENKDQEKPLLTRAYIELADIYMSNIDEGADNDDRMFLATKYFQKALKLASSGESVELSNEAEIKRTLSYCFHTLTQSLEAQVQSALNEQASQSEHERIAKLLRQFGGSKCKTNTDTANDKTFTADIEPINQDDNLDENQLDFPTYKQKL